MIHKGSKFTPHAISCDEVFKGNPRYEPHYPGEPTKCPERFVYGGTFSMLRVAALASKWTEQRLPGGVLHKCPMHSPQPRRLFRTTSGGYEHG